MRLLLLLWAAVGVLAELPAPGPGNWHNDLKFHLGVEQYDFCQYCMNWCINGFAVGEMKYGLPQRPPRPIRNGEICEVDCSNFLRAHLENQSRLWVNKNFRRAPVDHPLQTRPYDYEQYGYEYAGEQTCDSSGGTDPLIDPPRPPAGSQIDLNAAWSKRLEELKRQNRDTPDTIDPGWNRLHEWVPLDPPQTEDGQTFPMVGLAGNGGGKGGGNNNGGGSRGNGNRQKVASTGSQQPAGNVVKNPEIPRKSREAVGAGRGIDLTSPFAKLQEVIKQGGANIQAMTRWTDCMVSCMSQALGNSPNQIINRFQACSIPKGCDPREVRHIIPSGQEGITRLQKVLDENDRQLKWIQDHQGNNAAVAFILSALMMITTRGRVIRRPM
ncbi:MAG: hypothetical protein M1823_001834 [Watsoniomyces obsoletus]|nr:MAG: hypothetical protein M1823_001834 [Watsoniomyces obsoletus]